MKTTVTLEIPLDDLSFVATEDDWRLLKDAADTVYEWLRDGTPARIPPTLALAIKLLHDWAGVTSKQAAG